MVIVREALLVPLSQASYWVPSDLETDVETLLLHMTSRLGGGGAVGGY